MAPLGPHHLCVCLGCLWGPAGHTFHHFIKNAVKRTLGILGFLEALWRPRGPRGPGVPRAPEGLRLSIIVSLDSVRAVQAAKDIASDAAASNGEPARSAEPAKALASPSAAADVANSAPEVFLLVIIPRIGINYSSPGFGINYRIGNYSRNYSRVWD